MRLARRERLAAQSATDGFCAVTMQPVPRSSSEMPCQLSRSSGCDELWLSAGDTRNASPTPNKKGLIIEVSIRGEAANGVAKSKVTQPNASGLRAERETHAALLVSSAGVVIGQGTLVAG